MTTICRPRSPLSYKVPGKKILSAVAFKFEYLPKLGAFEIKKRILPSSPEKITICDMGDKECLGSTSVKNICIRNEGERSCEREGG